MIECGQDLHLYIEALTKFLLAGQVWVEDLYRTWNAQFGVVGTIDRAKTANSDLGIYHARSKLGTDQGIRLKLGHPPRL